MDHVISCPTSIFRQLPTIDLVLYHIGPVQGALVEVEVQSNCVPQSWYEHAEFSLVKVNPPDLVPIGKDDKRFEGICRREGV